MALIKYWKQNQRPKTLSVYPSGNLTITFDGYDTIAHSTGKKILERYFVKGLIWGSEMIWTDASGHLVALFTNDAEGDKFEAIEQSYVDALPLFISKAASYGMKNLKVSSNVKHEIFALTNTNIIDVVSGNHIPRGTVIIKNGVIDKVGSVEKIKIPKGIKVIDLAGKSLLPGLWDMHAHFQQVEWGPAYLAAGVTTVRDCGNEFEFINAIKNAIDQGNGIGPRILRAGIIDGDGKMALGIVRANNAEEARAAVNRYKAAGYDQIKIYSSIKPEMIKVIANEAHKVGLSVTGHLPSGVSLQQAIELGQNQFNHFPYIYRAMLSKPDQEKLDLNDSTARKILTLLKEKNIVVDPTIGIYEWVFRSLDQPLDAFEPGVNYMPETLKEIFKNIGLPEQEASNARYKNFLAGGKQLVVALHKMGVPVVAGTDMMVPGYSIYREIELYHEAGLTALEALQTATIVPARVMKLENETGSITVGKRADLIIVDGDPIKQLSLVRRVSTVIGNGIIYDPAELRSIVEFKR